ncbi:MAG: ABC transporter permease [Cyclobacteriaceae bacterium]
MLGNYFITAYRFLKHHFFFSTINLVGFAIALAACLLMTLYVNLEMSYDQFHTKADRTFRLVTDVSTNSTIAKQSSSGPMGPSLLATFPEVEDFVRILPDYFLVQNESNKDIFDEESIAYADGNLFEVFDFVLIKGNPNKLFTDPFNVVISETSAIKYFGTINALGKTLLLDGKNPALVTGVMEDIPANSHIQTNMFISMSTLLDVYSPIFGRKWDLFGFYTYLVLPEENNAKQLESKLPEWIKEHINNDQAEYLLSLEPLTEVYFHGAPRAYRGGSSIHGNFESVRAFVLIAVLVLLIASFNFVNLTTALSLHRSKEIGVRKVLGAMRYQLVVQFITDAVLLSVTSGLVAILLASLVLPQFNTIAGKVVITDLFSNISLLATSVGVAILIGILAGTYPALVLSGFKPIHVLKGKLKTGQQGKWIRKTLVTAQFSISIILIVLTSVVYIQVNFMQNQDLGFRKAQMISIDYHFDQRITKNPNSLKQSLLSVAGVEEVSLSSSTPGRLNHRRNTQIENIDKELQELESDAYYVDWNFISQYNIKILTGRDFSESFATDMREAMILNESAVRYLGFQNADEVIGKKFTQNGKTGTVIGVTENFHYHSLIDNIRPLTMRVEPGYFTFLTISLAGQNIPTSLAKIESIWQSLYPDLPLSYSFNDITYDQIYSQEMRQSKLFTGFSTLAIIISCLGLLGITALNITNRTKEIGVRKVLGSSSLGIIRLLSRESVILVIIAAFIATPIAWGIVEEWLNGFAYRISPTIWIYLGAGSLVAALSLITIGFQTIRASLANPVDVLKTD